ncbi:hypothetical protein L208DRAFT_1186819, partial [Tricholoma matsutake]
QKYDRHHLCKHLVQSVGLPSRRFWREVIRRRVLPIYRHPDLTRDSSNDLPGDSPDGGITDGDDHIWTGDVDMLR